MDERLLSSAALSYTYHFPSDHHSRTVLSLVRTFFCYTSTLAAKRKLIALPFSSLSCYTSLELEKYGIAFCTSSISASYISALAVSSPTSEATPKSGVISGSWVYGNFKNQVVNAKPIFVAYQSTDSEILQLLTPSLRSPSTTSASGTTPTSTPPTSTVTTGSTIHGGLSQGSKVAIGVTIPVAVLAIIVTILLCYIRRRRKSQMPTHSAHDGTGVWQAKAELPAESNTRSVAEPEGSQPRGHSMR